MNIKIIAGAMLVAVSLGLLGCDTLPPTDDQMLKQAVLERLNRDELLRRQMLSASVQGGVVTLHGAVSDEGIRLRAVSVAQATPGVQGQVRDQMTRR
jgi:osmotically-inducible protein OsmY